MLLNWQCAFQHGSQVTRPDSSGCPVGEFSMEALKLEDNTRIASSIRKASGKEKEAYEEEERAGGGYYGGGRSHLPNRILPTKSLFGYEAEQFVFFDCHFLPFSGYCAYLFYLCFIFCMACNGFSESDGHQTVRLPEIYLLE